MTQYQRCSLEVCCNSTAPVMRQSCLSTAVHTPVFVSKLVSKLAQLVCKASLVHSGQALACTEISMMHDSPRSPQASCLCHLMADQHAEDDMLPYAALVNYVILRLGFDILIIYRLHFTVLPPESTVHSYKTHATMAETRKHFWHVCLLQAAAPALPVHCNHYGRERVTGNCTGKGDVYSREQPGNDGVGVHC